MDLRLSAYNERFSDGYPTDSSDDDSDGSKSRFTLKSGDKKNANIIPTETIEAATENIMFKLFNREVSYPISYFII